MVNIENLRMLLFASTLLFSMVSHSVNEQYFPAHIDAATICLYSVYFEYQLDYRYLDSLPTNSYSVTFDYL